MRNSSFMPFYCYEARDAVGKLVRGEAEGPGSMDVMLELRRLGYDVIGVYEKKVPIGGYQIARIMGSVPAGDLAIFTRQLATVFSSGIPLMDALDGLSKGAESRRLRRAVDDVLIALNRGHRLSGAMGLRPDIFPRIFVGMVEAGEAAGKLDTVLHQLADFMERDMSLRRKVQTAMVYPVLIFLVCVMVVSVIALVVFPMFISFFEGLRMELPMPTQILYTITVLVRDPFVVGTALLVFGLGGWLLVDLVRKSPEYSKIAARVALTLPVVGRVQREVLVARFCRVMAMLLNAGITQMTALAAATKVLSNSHFRDLLEGVGVEVRDKGQSIGKALLDLPLMPAMAGSLLATGEAVGKLPQMLERLANLYDEEVNLSLQRLTLLLEPLMLSIMGLIVGYVLLAVFLPVYSLLDNL